MLAFGVIVIDCCLDTGLPHAPVMVYIILQVPAATPVTKPDVGSTVAIDGLLLLHEPVPPLKTTELAV